MEIAFAGGRLVSFKPIMTSMKIMKKEELDYKQLTSDKSNERYSLSAVISEGLGSKDIFIHQEILRPGRRASAPHFHRESEEFIYVLEGDVVAWEAGEEIDLSTGDTLFFEPNSGKLHYLENRSEEEVVLLVIKKKLPVSDVVYTGLKVL